jgi:hypothetical protein
LKKKKLLYDFSNHASSVKERGIHQQHAQKNQQTNGRTGEHCWETEYQSGCCLRLPLNNGNRWRMTNKSFSQKKISRKI